MKTTRRPWWNLWFCLLVFPALLPGEEAAGDPDAALEASLVAFRKSQPAVDQLLTEARVGEKLDGLLAPLPAQQLNEEETKLLAEVNQARTSAYLAMGTLLHKSPEDAARDRVARYAGRYRDGIFREVLNKEGAPEWTNGQSLAQVLSASTLSVVGSPVGAIMERTPFPVEISLHYQGQPLRDFRLTSGAVQIVAPPNVTLSGSLSQPLQEGVAKFSLVVSGVQKQVQLTANFAFDGATKEARLAPFDVEELIDAEAFQRQVKVLRHDSEVFLKDEDSPEKVRQLNQLALDILKLRGALEKNATTPRDFIDQLNGLLEQVHHADAKP